MRKTVKSSVDTGEAPSARVREEKIKQVILSGESLPDEKGKASEPKEKVASLSSYEKVKLEHELYELTFRALDVSISKHQIAIKVPKTSAFKFEPKVDTTFQINYRNSSYEAVYLGGIFDFSSDDSWAITFILNKQTTDTEAKDDGEKQ